VYTPGLYPVLVCDNPYKDNPVNKNFVGRKDDVLVIPFSDGRHF